jgi:glyoxylase-like metal-dependent hydrolase (beta-lactamase superfamily II)
MGSYVAKGITRTPPVAELDKLADGEVLDVPGSPRVIHAPGHTAGSCALFLEDRSLLFSGDVILRGSIEVAPVEGLMVTPDDLDVLSRHRCPVSRLSFLRGE